MERRRGAMLLKSSSTNRRESPSETSRSTAIGCMSGIFRFLSKHHHSNRRKFLIAFGKKEEQSGSGEDIVDRRIVSTDSHSPRSATKVEEMICSRSSSEAAAEKRMFLIGALAKCDEDLRELKKIIEELKSDSFVVDRDDDDATDTEAGKVKDELVTDLNNGEQPSPVSVLDELTRSPQFSRCARGRSLQYGKVQQQQQIRIIQDEEFLGSLHLLNTQQAALNGNRLSGSPEWRRRAMVETVEKACSEMTWGEKRELERIALALQDQIYKNLIDEMVKEVMEIGNKDCARHMKLDYINGMLPRRGCMRRLSY